MQQDKYVGLDAHQSSSVIEVMGGKGACLMQTIIPTQAEAIRGFFSGLSGTVHVTFEEGPMAAWLYDLIQPLVAEVVVCNPRANKLLAVGNKGDRVDAHNLADLLRLGRLKSVYHKNQGVRVLKELVHNYDALTGDRTRAMNRLKALYRGRGISCSGRDVYYKRNREEWLEKLQEEGRRCRAEYLYRQLDQLSELRRESRRVMVKEARRHKAYKILRQIKVLGPIRVSQIIAVVVTPHRFRTKRQFWPYVGLGVVTRSSSEYEFNHGRLLRREKVVGTRGLNRNYNHRLKYVFKGAAISGMRQEPFQSFYEGLLAKGMRPEMVRLTLARKIAAVTLAIWKKGEKFDALKLGGAVI